MNGNININPDEVITYGQAIQTDAENFNAQVKAIYNIVDDLKEAWTGSSAERYTANIESFKTSYEKFGELINNYGSLLVAVGNDYAELEKEF